MINLNKQAFLEALAFEGLIKTAAGPHIPPPKNNPALRPFYAQASRIGSGIYANSIARNIVINPVDHRITFKPELIDEINRIANTITGPAIPGLPPGSPADLQYRLGHLIALQKLKDELDRQIKLNRIRPHDEQVVDFINTIGVAKDNFDRWLQTNHPHLVVPGAAPPPPPPPAPGAAPAPAVAGVAPPPPLAEEPYPAYATMVPVDTFPKKKEEAQGASTFPDQSRVQTDLKQDPFVQSQIARVPGIPKVEDFGSPRLDTDLNTGFNTGQVRFVGNPTV
jgi:hypothetical protein